MDSGMDKEDLNMEVTIVIPNYNGIEYLKRCLASLKDDAKDVSAHIIVVDNGSTDGSPQWIEAHCPEAELIALKENTGFSHAVNLGIRRAGTPYVILLNNDTEVKSGFTGALLRAITSSDRIFSVSAKMLDMKHEDLLDNAGDLYCALGWAFARGKGKPAVKYDARTEIFSACAGAAIYRKSVFEEIGYFDERHFAYLEDVDIGWRAKIYGYRNFYEPSAQVLHAGSASSGSRYNAFKASLSSANSVYIIGKNMPLLQCILNLPFLLSGYLIKYIFFLRKKLGGVWFKGCMRGLAGCFSAHGRAKKVKFTFSHLAGYGKIQLELWRNLWEMIQK